jgi:hypothetical protein
MGTYETHSGTAHAGQEPADSLPAKCVPVLLSSCRGLQAGQALVFVALLFLAWLATLDRLRAEEARARDAKVSPKLCLVEVLHSEELPLAPPFYHTVRATLRVTPPDRPPFETTVRRAIPWQSPPPRQGQRILVPCDLALIESSLHLN